MVEDKTEAMIKKIKTMKSSPTKKINYDLFQNLKSFLESNEKKLFKKTCKFSFNM